MNTVKKVDVKPASPSLLSLLSLITATYENQKRAALHAAIEQGRKEASIPDGWVLDFNAKCWRPKPAKT